MERLAAIVGPTGVGKSRIAVQAASILEAEIISCDSMQVYRRMNIGTAKINSAEMKGIRHHLIDIVEPNQPFSVSQYKRMAQGLITEITQRSNLPMLVGGTGLYYQVVVDDYQLEPMDTDPHMRVALGTEAQENGNEILYMRLQELDPAAAEKINVNDRKRIIRALEVIEKTGKPFSDFQTKNPNRYMIAAIGLTMPRDMMYRRIDQRVDKMIEQGLFYEVEELLERGYDTSLNSMQAIGYSHIARFLRGEITKEEAIDIMKRDSRRYAKRQLTWFRRDNRIKWLDLAENTREEDIIKKICAHVRRTIM